MHMPCEIVSKIYFPVIRNILAYELVVVRGYSQQEASKHLGLTQAAIAQYLRNIRGNKKIEEIKKDNKLYLEIKHLASNIHKMSREEKFESFCRLCRTLRENGHLERYGFSREEVLKVCGK